MHRSLRDHMNDLGDEKPTHYNSACAAAGQLALMSLYDTMFSTCDIEPSQFLVTQRDFNDEGCRANLKSSLSSIVGVGMLPIVNENDAVSGNSGYANVPAGCFSDNDGLAALVAQLGAGQESEIPNFKASYLGRFPLVLADFWTSDHLSERSRSVDAFSGTRARGTLTLKRR